MSFSDEQIQVSVVFEIMLASSTRNAECVSSQSRKPGFGDVRVNELTGLKVSGVSMTPDWLAWAVW